MGDSPKWVKSKKRRKRKRERKRERLNDGDNNGQATHGARMAHALRTQAAWAKKEGCPGGQGGTGDKMMEEIANLFLLRVELAESRVFR